MRQTFILRVAAVLVLNLGITIAALHLMTPAESLAQVTEPAPHIPDNLPPDTELWGDIQPYTTITRLWWMCAL